MSCLRFGLVLALAISCLGGCASQRSMVSRANFDELSTSELDPSPDKVIYLVRHGWHTGLILPIEGISEEIWPEVRDYRNSDYVEFGWGDERTYKDQRIRLTTAAKAAFLPTSSVLHVVGVRGPVLEFYPESDITEIHFNEEQFDKICRFIANSFERDAWGRARAVGPGRYGEARFYQARDKYYVLKTCNVWTARALRAADLPMVPRLSISAVSVMKQSRVFGHVLQKHPQQFKRSDPTGRRTE